MSDRTAPGLFAIAAGLLAVAASLFPLATPAAAETDDETLAELVRILHDEGVIDGDEYSDLATRASRRQDKKDWTDRIAIWAQLRTRYEAFFFDDDAVSQVEDAMAAPGVGGLQDRHRVRYRGRINLKGEVASRATVYFRLTSGSAESRSGDQTLGAPGPDFDKDDLRLDLAYVTLSPFPDGELPGVEGGYLAADLGKVPNPFRTSAFGPEGYPWDADLTFEGGTLRIKGNAGPVSLFSSSGAYVLDENSRAKDPKLVATQLGGSVPIADSLTFGTRGSVYHFTSLDDGFFTRAAAVGNIADGLSRRNGSIQVVEGAAFLRCECFERFPILVFGSYSHNLSARSSRLSPGVDTNANAWSAGVWLGDKKDSVLLGGAYYVIEANAFPAMFIDSDNTDGLANRRGWSWILSRQLFEGVDFVYTALLMDHIEGGVPFITSVRGSDRFRMRADLIFNF